MPRVRLGWTDYDEGTSEYPDGYAAARFPVELDGCRSRGNGLPIESYRWTVRDPSGERMPVERVGTCEARFEATSEGRHQVRLRVTSARGDDRQIRSVVVDDALILVLGDSMASGEGNPPWVDERCHRSTKSGLSLAARRLEDRSSRSTVTLVNLACSGAEVDSGLLGPYAGIDPPAVPDPNAEFGLGTAPPLEAQIDAARRWLCGGDICRSDARHVDAIFLSIGINDLSFSGIVVDCANPLNAPCQNDLGLQQDIETGLVQVATGLEDLAARLTGPFAGTEVYLMQYPDDPFNGRNGGDGCGVLRWIDEDEAAWMHSVGRRLDANLKGFALRHRFYLVDGVARAFRGHGYCAGSTWFVGVAESFLRQRGKDGALHPNRRGHDALARRILAAWDAPKPERRLLGNAKVTFQRINIRDDSQSEPEIPSTVILRGVATQEGYWMRGGLASWIDRMIPNGEEIPLTGDEYTIEIPIWNLEDLHVTASTCLRSQRPDTDRRLQAMILPDDRGGRLPIDGRGEVVVDPGNDDIDTGTLRCLKTSVDHPANTRWGAGTHTITDELPDGSLAVTYRVRFIPELRQGQPLPDAPELEVER
jgi:hypothetical protein